MALSVTGEDAIVEAIKTLLQAQLQDELTAQTTAAVAAGVRDSKWTVADLVEATTLRSLIGFRRLPKD